MNKDKQKVIWITAGALSEQLHQAARIKPASYLMDFGWDVTLVTARTENIEEEKSKVNIVQLAKINVPVIGTLIYHLKILYFLISKKITGKIIYFQTKSAPFLLILPLLQKIFNVNKGQFYIMDTRTVPMDTEGVRGKIRKIAFDFCQIIAKKIKIYQTAITDEMVKYVGIPRDRLISIWESGVEIEEFNVCREKRKWPNENEPLKIVYIGAIRKERNLASAIEAVSNAKSVGVNVELNIVGRGPYVTFLKQLTQKQNKNAVNIFPSVKRKFIPDVLSENHIGLLPFPDEPKMRVSSAIKMFEYMAAGMPVIATKITAHTNVFKSGKFVFWDSKATSKTMLEAILEADKQKNNLQKYGEESYALGKKFTWSNSAEKLSNGFYSVIRTHNNV